MPVVIIDFIPEFFHLRSPLAKNCAELHKSGSKTSGVFKISPDDKQSVAVFCDQTTAGGGWTVFQKRLSTHFKKSLFSYLKPDFNTFSKTWMSAAKTSTTALQRPLAKTLRARSSASAMMVTKVTGKPV